VPLDSEQTNRLVKLGKNLERERKKRCLTQAALAEKADLAIRNVQRIEAGELNILVTTLLRLKESLGCSWLDLLGK